jgi:hypothetical protein
VKGIDQCTPALPLEEEEKAYRMLPLLPQLLVHASFAHIARKKKRPSFALSRGSRIRMERSLQEKLGLLANDEERLSFLATKTSDLSILEEELVALVREFSYDEARIVAFPLILPLVKGGISALNAVKLVALFNDDSSRFDALECALYHLAINQRIEWVHLECMMHWFGSARYMTEAVSVAEKYIDRETRIDPEHVSVLLSRVEGDGFRLAILGDLITFIGEGTLNHITTLFSSEPFRNNALFMLGISDRPPSSCPELLPLDRTATRNRRERRQKLREAGSASHHHLNACDAWMDIEKVDALIERVYSACDARLEAKYSLWRPSQVLLGDDETKCVVCMDRRRCIVLIPCNHFLLCEECFSNPRLHLHCPRCTIVNVNYLKVRW